MLCRTTASNAVAGGATLQALRDDHWLLLLNATYASLECSSSLHALLTCTTAYALYLRHTKAAV
jgi:hypothetical protein